jgi:toxin ParE1/3/4
MKQVILSRAAFKDLAEIWHYIAADNLGAADRVRNELERATHSLANMPGMGHQREDVSDPTIRFWRVYSYLIAYRMEGETLYVLRIVHGARNFRDLFDQRS